MNNPPTRSGLAGVADNVVASLKSQPVFLGLLTLNLLGIGAAVWFLSSLSAAQASRIDLILKSCLPGVKP